MAKRKKKGGDKRRLEAAATRAAQSFTPVGRVRQDLRRDFFSQLSKRPPRTKTPTPPLTFEPRQRSLRSERRAATTAALGGTTGTGTQARPLGERRRRQAQARLPEELRRIICEQRKKRREALFATGGAGRGRKPRRPSNRRQYALVPVNC